MLPPPRKSQLSTNADFRKLLETPRAERMGDDSRQSKPKKAAAEQEGQQKPKKKPYRPKPEVEKKEDDGSGYRRVINTQIGQSSTPAFATVQRATCAASTFLNRRQSSTTSPT